MANELVKKGEGVYEIKATLEGKEWKDCNNKAIDVLVKNVQIKGFRKGQAPKELAKRNIKPEDLIREWQYQGLNALYRKVLSENKLQPFAQPGVVIEEMSDDKLTVTFTITVFPEVTLGQYKDISIALDEVKVEEQEIEDAVNHVLDDNAELILKEGAAEIGDTVVFDFKGYVDGKEFEGGSAQNYSLVLGSNQFIPGFEDQLVGAKSESKVDVNVTFPEQYIKDLAGKDAKFVCMVHEIKTKKKPELNDEFVKELNIQGVNTIDELKEYEKKQIALRKEQSARSKHFNAVIDKIVEFSKVSIADEVVKNEIEGFKKNLINQIEQNGLTFAQYKEITGLTDDKIEEQFKADARNNLVHTLVLQKIAEVENLLVSRKELDEYYQRMATNYGMKLEEVKKHFNTPEAERQVVEQILNTKIQRFILANNPPKGEEVAKEEPKKEEKVETKKTTTKKTTAKKTTTKKTVKKED